MTKPVPLPIFTFNLEKYTAQCLKFNLDYQILYAGTQSGEILICDLEVIFVDKKKMNKNYPLN